MFPTRATTGSRKIGLDGVITTVAGTGVGGNTGDGGPAISARIYSPYGLAVDTAGDIFIADWMFNRIRKVTPDGKIATIAGSDESNYSGDGGPARTRHCTALTRWRSTPPATSTSRTARTTDSRDHDGWQTSRLSRATVRRIFTGDGGQAVDAAIRTPFGVAVDAHGNIFIADTYIN